MTETTLLNELLGLNLKATIIKSAIDTLSTLVSLGIILWWLGKYMPKWIDKIIFAIKERRAIDNALRR